MSEDSKLYELVARVSIASLYAASPSLRNKVIEILSHVNKRVKHQLYIGLPLLDLWKLYGESSAAPMVGNFCKVYIEMAINRISKEEKQMLIPEFLTNISKLPNQHQDFLLRISAKAIGECHSSQVSDEAVSKYRRIVGSRDCEIFVEFCLQTVLYQLSSQSGACPAGLSMIQCERVTGKEPLKGDALSVRKSGILNIIEVLELPSGNVYPIYIAACSDSQESVLRKGEQLLKRSTSGTSASENLAPESKVSPANIALRARLMSNFCRSIAAANTFPSTLQCIYGCIFGSDTTSRLKQLGMEFTAWVFKHARMDQLTLMGSIILTGILKILDNSSSLDSGRITIIEEKST